MSIETNIMLYRLAMNGSDLIRSTHQTHQPHRGTQRCVPATSQTHLLFNPLASLNDIHHWLPLQQSTSQDPSLVCPSGRKPVLRYINYYRY
jgi:hypothetical protein